MTDFQITPLDQENIPGPQGQRIRDSLGRIHMTTEITRPFWLIEKRLRDLKLSLIGDKLAEAASVRG